jgi:hypothetical protein
MTAAEGSSKNVAIFPSNCAASHPRTRKSSDIYILFKKSYKQEDITLNLVQLCFFLAGAAGVYPCG